MPLPEDLIRLRNFPVVRLTVSKDGWLVGALATVIEVFNDDNYMLEMHDSPLSGGNGFEGLVDVSFNEIEFV